MPKNTDAGIRLSANLSYSGIHNIKTEDALEIETAGNPSYESTLTATAAAQLSAKLKPEKPRGRGKRGSRFKKILCTWLKRDQPTADCPEEIKEEITEESHYI